jgi:hypothetical protein
MMGRPAIGDKAMTAAERQRKHRERVEEERYEARQAKIAKDEAKYGLDCLFCRQNSKKNPRKVFIRGAMRHYGYEDAVICSECIEACGELVARKKRDKDRSHNVTELCEGTPSEAVTSAKRDNHENNPHKPLRLRAGHNRPWRRVRPI